jgi:tRNA G18 (ribose-2'-O)-methylase SpoU
VEWEYYERVSDAITHLRHQGYQIVACEQAQETTMLQDFNVQKGAPKNAFIFGNEVFGVDQDLVSKADVVLEIPQFGTKHSFNVAVSCGIVLWEAVKPFMG